MCQSINTKKRSNNNFCTIFQIVHTVHLAIIRLYFPTGDVNLTYVVTVFLPRHVSVQFAPSSGGLGHLYLKTQSSFGS